ncbi:MAG: Fe-S cluster assembly protein SufD [Micromonosporaceae bacterium]|nr:Fe-S cluster assembly protein SufD [Micromonosporaceae bacterium]
MTALDSVKDSLELERVESHLHPEGSFDLDDHPVPTGREEIWRFTPLRRLRGLHQDAPLGGTSFEVETDLADGVTAASVPVADSTRGTSNFLPTDRIAARVWQAATSVFEVGVPAEAAVDGVSVIRLRGTGTDQACAGQLLVRAGRFSRATVVVVYSGSAVWAENVEIVVEDGAELTFVTVQDWERDAVHAVAQHAKVGRDATLKHVAVSVGGDLTRSDLSVEYAGPGGQVELLGLYFADAGQHIEHRLFVDHTAPRTRSNVLYKGALQGKDAHTVWVGNVLIRKVAEEIDTHEENRNLVLTDGARADSIPNLEIETGEILGAGHASATGRFDDEQLFYLMSRGIPEVEARKLVVRGFFADMLAEVPVEDLRERLAATIESRLAAAGA